MIPSTQGCLRANDELFLEWRLEEAHWGWAVLVPEQKLRCQSFWESVGTLAPELMHQTECQTDACSSSAFHPPP